MSTPRPRLILANGEQYAGPVEKSRRGRPPELPRSYADARDLVKHELAMSMGRIASLPKNKRLRDESVLCLRLHPDMTAKTYDPEGIFGLIPDLGNVGSRNYRVSADSVAQTTRIKKQIESNVREVTGSMLFVRSTDVGFRRLIQILDRAEGTLPKPFIDEIQRIERFDLLDPNEQIQGFDPSWESGRVELVLHPSRHSGDEQTNFLKSLFHDHGVELNRPNFAYYDDGPLFVSCRVNRDALLALSGANPLRMAHPLDFAGFEELRAGSLTCPPPSGTTTRSTIKVGMFDGGVDPFHPLFLGHVEQDEALSIKTPSSPACVAHGTAVAGAILYGPLDDHDSRFPIIEPKVSVVSIRTLPTSDPSDMDLYECIDVIEAAVPARSDIKTFNVSFGPRGPILDDSISRFTFALDRLAVSQKVTFCVAVGNDGIQIDGMNRIQAPADLVNGLGVGAFSMEGPAQVHAPYSCQGPGREGGKLKPDVVAFGGCDKTPFHLVATTPGAKTFSAGTSFSTPIVSSLSAQAGASFDRASALLARALIIHTAEHPSGEPDHFFGHGAVAHHLYGLVRCDDKNVTIVFQGDIPATKSLKLPILLPKDLVKTGKVSVKWTVAALPPVAPNHPADYTTICIEDTFYPNSQVFSFTPPKGSPTKKKRNLHLVRNSIEVGQLKSSGWKQSKLPVSGSGNQYNDERARRADHKWEPIVRRVKSKDAISMEEPMLVLDAIGRHGTKARVEYAAVITISAPKFAGDLYDAIVRRYPALVQVRLRSEAELRIQIS